MDALGWLDVLLGAVLIGSALIGLWRGVVYELLSLAGWLVAWWVAHVWGEDLGRVVTGESLSPSVRGAVGWVLMFVLALVAWRLATWAVQQLLHASPLAPVDRGLGGLFGLLRGLVIVAALVLVVGYTPLAQRPFWQASPGVQWAQALLGLVSPVLPEGWRRHAANAFRINDRWPWETPAIVTSSTGPGAASMLRRPGREWSSQCAASSV